jgi:DNA invertase Pin-like site-specific DNA recombinase
LLAIKSNDRLWRFFYTGRKEVLAMKKVLTILPKPKAAMTEVPLAAKLKVCAYCRVSSASSEQMDSYENQVAYYTGHIQQKTEWEFAGIYADGGITGTKKEGRTEFNRMIRDAQAGRIDLIITKSISRFVRNTADCLEIVRYLKELGIAVFFERENINTLSAESELLMTVLASIAQEESRSTSENIKWAYQKKFQKGKVVVVSSRFLGYDLDENGQLQVNPAEAKIVKLIFREYIAGKGTEAIAKLLEAMNVRTVTGSSKWHDGAVRNILTNEKYCGDLVQQKTFTENHLTHRKKKNKGELPMYRVQNNHEAIISREDFELVQRLMAERAAKYGNLPGDRDKYLNRYAFSGKLVCDHCGANFIRRTWNSKGQSKQIVWQCGTYIKEGKSACSMKAVDDITLKAVFVRAFNKLYKNKDTVLKRFLDNVEKGLRVESIGGQDRKLELAIERVGEQMKALIRRQIKGSSETMDFQAEYANLQEQLEALRNQKNDQGGDESKLAEVMTRTQEIAAVLEGQVYIMEEFDEEICSALVERVKVLTPTHLVFELKNGLAMEQQFVKERGIHGLQ